mmetsp:Transcript_23506/g.61163  ORF Transcript_23506/g.61163 Transcript_23506/m.61163 type:complete len:219 (+) Transcript_23506:820-1476(+)
MEQRGPCPGIWGTPLKPCLCQRCLCTLVVAVVRKTPDQCVPGHPVRSVAVLPHDLEDARRCQHVTPCNIPDQQPIEGAMTCTNPNLARPQQQFLSLLKPAQLGARAHSCSYGCSIQACFVRFEQLPPQLVSQLEVGHTTAGTEPEQFADGSDIGALVRWPCEGLTGCLPQHACVCYPLGLNGRNTQLHTCVVRQVCPCSSSQLVTMPGVRPAGTDAQS